MSRLKNYFFFILYLLFRPSLAVISIYGIYIPAYLQFEWLRQYDIDTIIDIGANRGDVSSALHYLFPDATIHAFEPIKNECKKIKQKLDSKKVIINNIALSDKVGFSNFFINKHSPSSSFLPLSNDGKKDYPELSEDKKISVKTTTLDSYFSNKNLGKNVFLKIDVQGAEKIVFDGAKKIIKKISIIHIELSYKKIYKNQCLFNDIYDFLVKNDFNYYGTISESFFFPVFNQSHQQNAIFIKNGFIQREK